MKTVGILGGMGSMATVDLFSKIIKHTHVTCDQDHIHIIVDNYAEIPDRTHYILNHEHSPLPKMIEAAKRLEAAGSDFIAMPCNTAHYFYEEIRKNINIPIVHMMEETEKYTKEYRNLILFATHGTYISNLYNSVLYPDEKIRNDLSTLIYDYKKRHETNQVLKSDILKHMKHIDGIILGCTELPLIFDQSDTTIDLIDPTTILAKSIIKKAGARLADPQTIETKQIPR